MLTANHFIPNIIGINYLSLCISLFLTLLLNAIMHQNPFCVPSLFNTTNSKNKNKGISITEPFPHYLVPHSHPFSLFGVFHTMGTWPCIARRGPRLMTGNSASPGIVDLLTKCNLCKKYRYFFFKNNRIKVVFVFYEPNTTAL